jgi:hypothetical protein
VVAHVKTPINPLITRNIMPEQDEQEKGLYAQHLTPDLIDATIADESYYVLSETRLTVCRLILKNGFKVLGESACASPENFDAELGRKLAKKNARDKIWMLEGYLLKDKIYNGKLTA